jgi:drug/metabolite transporter (DMT)-like permease
LAESVLNKESRGLSAALLIGLWLVWGYSWTASKLGLPYIGPLQLAFWRTLFGLATLAAVLIARGGSLRPTPFWPTFWLGMTQTAGFGALTTLALLAGGAGKVSVLAYTMPFWTLLLARRYLGERLHPMQWGAVLLALAGLVLILRPWHWQGSPLSDLLAVGGGLAWAASAVIAKKMRRRHRVGTLELTFWQMFWGILPLGILAFLLPAPAAHWTWQLWAVLLYVGVLASGLGWLVWLVLLSRLTAGMAGLNVLAIPAVAVLLAWLQLGEAPDAIEATGMALIGLALALIACITVVRERQAHRA